MAMQQRDDRLRAAAHAHHQAAEFALAAQHGVGAAVQRCARRIEVQPGAEHAARTLHRHHAHGIVALQTAEVVVQLTQQPGVQRVQLVGAVQLQPVGRALVFDEDGFVAHIRSLTGA
jgi:hypothetical protein